MITSLTISNLKGITTSVRLEKYNLIYGPNSVGKTAILDGITLALLGYHPRLGKKPNLTFALATAGQNQMSVGFNRSLITWKRNSKGAVSVDGLESIIDLPPVMLNLKEWLALTGPQKVQYIIEHCGDLSESGMQSLDQIIELNPQVRAEAVKLDKGNTGEYLRKLGDLAKANRQKAAAEHETIQGAINAALVANPVSPKDHTREIKRLEARIRQLDDEVSRVKGEQAERERRRVKDAELLKSMEDQVSKKGQLEQNLKDAEENEAAATQTLERLGVEIVALSTQLEAIRMSTAGHRAELEAKRRRRETLQQSTSNACPCCGQACDIKAVIDQIECEMESAGDAITELTAECSQIEADLEQLKAKEKAAKNQLTASLMEKNSATGRLASVNSIEQQLQSVRLRLAEPIQASADVSDKHAEIAELTQKLKVIQDEQREYVAYLGVERERQRLIETRDQKSHVLDMAKQLVDAIKSMEKKILEKVIGSVCREANRIINPVLGRGIRYDNDQFMLDGATLETISGSEEVVIFAGLQMALCIRIPNRILVLDELGRLYPDRLELLFKAINNLLEEGVIDQFVGVIPSSRPTLPEGIEANLIEMGAKEEEVPEP